MSPGNQDSNCKVPNSGDSDRVDPIIVDPMIVDTGHAAKVIAFGDQVDAVTVQGKSIAFGDQRAARVTGPVGYAVAFGQRGVAEADTAVSLLSSFGIALSPRVAVSLNHAGKAIGREIAVAENLDCEAHSESMAVAVGRRGLADGLLAISLGKEGRAVAREGGTIALAVYEQSTGHWESGHGCDPGWIEGELKLTGLKVSKVGENGIRADFVYQLDSDGQFKEIGAAGERQTYDRWASTAQPS